MTESNLISHTLRHFHYRGLALKWALLFLLLRIIIIQNKLIRIF